MTWDRIIERDDLKHVSYPPGFNTAEFFAGARKMAEVLYETYKQANYRFIGTGSSGAMLMAAVGAYITSWNSGYGYTRVVQMIYINLEPRHQHYRGDELNDFDDKDVINIVIDDHIASGNTMRQIFNNYITRRPHNKVDAILVNLPIDEFNLDGIDYHVKDIFCRKFNYTSKPEPLTYK